MQIFDIIWNSRWAFLKVMIYLNLSFLTLFLFSHCKYIFSNTIIKNISIYIRYYCSVKLRIVLVLQNWNSTWLNIFNSLASSGFNLCLPNHTWGTSHKWNHTAKIKSKRLLSWTVSLPSSQVYHLILFL